MGDPWKPSIGRIVHCRTDQGDVVPAIITRVWSDHCVNLTVFQDNAPPSCLTSVLDISQQGESGVAWLWPPRA